MSELRLSNIDLFKYVLSKQCFLTPTNKLIMLGIFNHRNVYSFLCFPNLDTISEETGLSRRTIQRGIGLIVSDGDLIRVKTTSNGRTGRTFYFARFDWHEAIRISEDPDSVFSKTGDYDLLFAAGREADKWSPF